MSVYVRNGNFKASQCRSVALKMGRWMLKKKKTGSRRANWSWINTIHQFLKYKANFLFKRSLGGAALNVAKRRGRMESFFSPEPNDNINTGIASFLLE